jgi:hypothetical protein
MIEIIRPSSKLGITAGYKCGQTARTVREQMEGDSGRGSLKRLRRDVRHEI